MRSPAAVSSSAAASATVNRVSPVTEKPKSVTLARKPSKSTLSGGSCENGASRCVHSKKKV